MMASMETVGTYVASVETTEYREYVDVQLALDEALITGAGNAPWLQERATAMRKRAADAAASSPRPPRVQ